jgi:hypothetical protein
MRALKFFIKSFIALPLLVLGSIGTLGMLVGGEYLIALGVVLFMLFFFALCGWDAERDEEKAKKSILSRGVYIDFIADYLGSGVVIDLKNEKILVGNFKTGKITDFKDVKNIEWEDAPYKGTMKYNIHINTDNFEHPRLSAYFGGNKGMRDTAYAKLSAALKCS